VGRLRTGDEGVYVRVRVCVCLRYTCACMCTCTCTFTCAVCACVCTHMQIHTVTMCPLFFPIIWSYATIIDESFVSNIFKNNILPIVDGLPLSQNQDTVYGVASII